MHARWRRVVLGAPAGLSKLACAPASLLTPGAAPFRLLTQLVRSKARLVGAIDGDHEVRKVVLKQALGGIFGDRLYHFSDREIAIKRQQWQQTFL